VVALPETVLIDPRSTAIVVVDMQNDFAAPGGMFDRAGIPIGGIQAIVPPIRRVMDAGRAAGMRIVFLTMQFAADLSDAGAPEAPNRIKHRPLGLGEPVETPAGRGRILIEDTWNTEIVPELSPQVDDLVVAKHRYSGFHETALDSSLRNAGIDTLLFCGATTSVCVESTLRDAFSRDYRCVLLSDCTAEPIGADRTPSNHDATLLVIQTLFGWVAESGALLAAMSHESAQAAVSAAR
jgi:ureidoacrylate peracid hydrolase